MNTSFEKSPCSSTDEWYTPKEIIQALGVFDLDPCAPVFPLWSTAKHHYTIMDNGLYKDWFGRVWLNPPYSHPLIDYFLRKMAAHGNGISLLFNRLDTALFQRYVLSEACAILILLGRVKFYRPDGTQGGSPGCGSILAAYGKANAEALEQSKIKGAILYKK